MASNVQDEIDPANGTRSSGQDGQPEELPHAVQEHEQDSPGRILMQSVSDVLVSSAQSMKALVSGNATPALSDDGVPENGEEKSMLQSVGEIIMQSAQSVREAVTGINDGESAENEEEKSLVQSVGDRISQSAQSVKEAVTGGTAASEDGEEKTVLQAVGEKIVQSAKTVKDAVKGDVYIVPGDDETAELSILVHTILD